MEGVLQPLGSDLGARDVHSAALPDQRFWKVTSYSYGATRYENLSRVYGWASDGQRESRVVARSPPRTAEHGLAVASALIQGSFGVEWPSAATSVRVRRKIRLINQENDPSETDITEKEARRVAQKIATTRSHPVGSAPLRFEAWGPTIQDRQCRFSVWILAF